MHRFPQLQTWYRNLSLRFKLFLWLVPLLIIAIGSIGFFSYMIASNQLLSKIRQQQTDTADTTMSHLDYVARNVSDLFNYLYLSGELRDFLHSKPNDPDLYSTRKYAFDAIDRLVVTQDYLQSLIIYPLDGQEIDFTHQGTSAAMPAGEFKKTRLFKQIMAHPDGPLWGIEEGSGRLFVGDNKTKVIYARVLKDYISQKPIGIVIIGINEEDIRNTYASKASPESATLIIDKDGTILSESSGYWLGRNIEQTPYLQGKLSSLQHLNEAVNRNRWIFSESVSSATGWRTLIFEPKSRVLRQIKHIQILTLSVIFACFLLLLPLSWLTTAAVIKPIQRLLSSMRKVQYGDFTQNVEIKSLDEIGLLANTYNSMISRIKQLIDEVYHSHIMQREAELKLLQSQINPHFLYNTLDTICWTAEQRDQKDIAEMAYSLGQIFRISLSDGKDIIPLEMEMKLVTHYIQLQKIRFYNRFSYNIDMNPQIARAQVPKLILQPFVENAIIHGIEPLKDSGFIQISAFPEGDQTIIEISDNGIGMEDVRLPETNAFTADKPDSERLRKGYAISNCRDRLQLFFGGDSDISLDSKPGIGTRVRITIPNRKENSDHDESFAG